MSSFAPTTRAPDVIGGAVLSCLGLVFLIGGVQYGIWSPDGQLEPGAMPFLSGCLLAFLGLCIGASALRPRGRRSATPQSTVADAPVGAVVDGSGPAGGATEKSHRDGDGSGVGDETPAAVDNPARSLALFALTAVAVTAITWIDIFVVLAALVTAILVFFEKMLFWKAATVAGIVIVACYLVFVVLLGVPLPTVF